MYIEQLFDEIYEAAVIPDRWVDVLDRLAGLADAEGTFLFVAAPGEPRWLSSERIRSRIEAWVEGPFYRDNPRSERLALLREPRFLTDLDAFTMDELDREPLYTSFLRPNGLGWCAGTAIHSVAGDTLVFSIEKAHAKGPVPREVAEKLDPLRPHLARAALLAARSGLERAHVTVEGLELIGLPAAILAHGGRVLAANRAILAYGPDIRIGAAERLTFASPRVQALFVDACANRSSASGVSIPVTRSAAHAAFVAHVLPLRGKGRDLFSSAELLLYITPVVLRAGPPPEILQTLFDLSPAEARVAAHLAEGQSVQAIAEKLAIQPNTVRVQLKSVFSKTGTSRQAELVSLLRLPSST